MNQIWSKLFWLKELLLLSSDVAGGEVCKTLCLMLLRANPERSFCEISRRSKTGGFVVVVVFTKEVLINISSY